MIIKNGLVFNTNMKKFYKADIKIENGKITDIGSFACDGDFIDAEGKMNLKGLLMADATSADAIVIGAYAQGYMFFDNNGIERILSETPTTQNAIIWKQIYEATMGAMAGGKIPPFFTVNDAEGNIAAGLYFNGTTFVDLFTNMAIGTDPSHDATIAAFKAADHITLTQGGMSVTFEFYH